MIGWILLIIISAALCGLGVYMEKKNSYKSNLGWVTGVVLLLVFGMACIVFIVYAIVLPFEERASINSFEKQKYYLETHVAKNEIEDAALTSEKLEKNNWLYTAQYDAENYSWFTPYADKILSLEEIQ